MGTGGTPPTTEGKSTQGSGTVVQTVWGLVIPLTVIVGLLILTALGKVPYPVSVPIVATIAGVHGGAAITTNTSG